jgi:hypothetical protein
MLPVKVVWLTRGQFTIIDPEDYEQVSRHRWRTAHGGARGHTFYAVRWSGPRASRRVIGLHEFLAGWSRTDHVNRNGLDNRRCNLREASAAQNRANSPTRGDNTSGHIGVCWDKENGKWMVRTGGRYVGRFADFDEAVKARHAATAERYGEFAPHCCDQL